MQININIKKWFTDGTIAGSEGRLNVFGRTTGSITPFSWFIWPALSSAGGKMHLELMNRLTRQAGSEKAHFCSTLVKTNQGVGIPKIPMCRRSGCQILAITS